MDRMSRLVVVGLLLGWPGAVQAQPWVEVVADLLDGFGAATVSASFSCSVRLPGVAGGVRRNALFEHPLVTERPARVEYRLDLPAMGTGERLLLAFYLALSDGIPAERPDHPWDGVRFAVEVEGHRLFEQECRDMRWQPGGVDLTPFAGRQVTLALLVGAAGNLAYDWALWGEPRLLHFRGTALQKPGRVSLTAGALALACRPGAQLRVRVRPPQGEPPPWQQVKAPPQEGRWMAFDFSVVPAQEVEVEWEPADAVLPDAVWLAAYRSQLQITQLTSASAVPLAGKPVWLRAVVNNAGRGSLRAGAARLELVIGDQPLAAQPLPALAPGASWNGEWEWRPPTAAGRWPLVARLLEEGNREQRREAALETFPAPAPGNLRGLANQGLRLEFVRAGEGYAYARVSAKRGDEWVALGVWRPLLKVVLDTPQGPLDWEIRPRRLRRSRPLQPGETALECDERLRDPEGVEWRVRLRIGLDPERPLARLRCEWSTAGERRVRALWGPQLYVGDGSWGQAKTWGLFPGLEYLLDGERSSNPRDLGPPLHDRRSPHPWKVTVPLMAISLGPGSQPPPPDPDFFFCPDSLQDMKVVSGRAPQPRDESLTLALLWDPHQKWDGERGLPSARFASPNFDEGMDNHRMGLFLPSIPDLVRENADAASEPYILQPGRSVALEAALLAAPGPAMVALREWLAEVGGLPAPPPWPRNFEEEMALCRRGFLESIWDAEKQQWKHVVEWGSAPTPGFAALLWLDGHITRDPQGRRQALERVETAAQKMLADVGPEVLVSAANCHIMRWEFPFLWGYLPEALPGLEGQIRALIQSQQADGGWRFGANPQQGAPLGREGDATVGTATHNAWTLLRYARITGDREALRAGEQALLFMERFRVPRGASVWECPWYAPDLVATAWALAAYTEGYRATGNRRWLHDAVYWAETGVPFHYLWSLPDLLMMLGASIPIFGSTFYSHSWLGMPVQWEGLMYGYHLQHLAQDLEQETPQAGASPLPAVLGLTSADWRRIAELATVSGMYQQVDEEGPRLGTYPDSITHFQQRNPVFIGPESIVANLLALIGYDPDIKTERLRAPGGEIVVSSGARIEELEGIPGSLRFRLRFFAGEPSHSLVAGVRPAGVKVNGRPLAHSAQPVRREPGWWWDDQRKRLYLVVPHEEEVVQVEIQRQD